MLKYRPREAFLGKVFTTLHKICFLLTIQSDPEVTELIIRKLTKWEEKMDKSCNKILFIYLSCFNYYESVTPGRHTWNSIDCYADRK